MTKTSPHAQGVARFDHAAAKVFYVGLDHPRRYSDVAAKFAVSLTTIRKWARRDDWKAAAAEADRRAAEKALEQTVRSRESRAVQTAKIRDLAADRIEAQLTPDESGVVKADDTLVVQAWKEADRQYRLDIGEATDRIEVHEVHEFVRRFVIGFDEVVEQALSEHLNGKGRQVLATIRSRVPALLEQTAGGVTGGDG